jgi:transcriptional regulator with GAF, ATPase, and Fis domain
MVSRAHSGERSLEDLSVQRLLKERDLYQGLLGLDLQSDPEPFLKNALELITSIVGAERGCLELFDPHGGEDGWFHAAGFAPEELEGVRARMSRGIIAEAIATGQVVLTPSALLDPRFRDRVSVKLSQIDAVLCVPIGKDPPRGILYLQSQTPEAFDEESVRQTELFARYLAPLAGVVERKRNRTSIDDVSLIRKRLKADDIIGESPALGAVLREVALVAPLDVGVLLLGDTGTGKTQMARVLHRNSARASGPFIELNCAALPEQLLESELFGAEAGAHSTAARRVEGKVAAAEGGTLLLDEIGELSLPAQAKLLQLLQSKTYYPLGSSRARTADARIIAATNVDLAEAVAEKRFREDLYYRLQVISIRLPALAERPGDAVLLAQFFCERAMRAHKLPNVALSPAALRAIDSSEWGGNMRELCNVVEMATIRAAAQGLKSIEEWQLFPDASPTRDSPAALTFQQETRRFQSGLVSKVLTATDWNVSEAARRLDLTRAHLYNLIKSFDLKR